MARMSDLTIGARVENIAKGTRHGEKGTVQRNNSGLYQDKKNGYVWVVWDNLENKIELSPQWEGHQFLKIID